MGNKVPKSKILRPLSDVQCTLYNVQDQIKSYFAIRSVPPPPPLLEGRGLYSKELSHKMIFEDRGRGGVKNLTLKGKIHHPFCYFIPKMLHIFPN